MKNYSTKYQALTEARKILGLPEKVPFKDIKEKYRSLSQKWHPDKNKKNPDQSVKRMQKINWAYSVLSDYCENYIFSFDEESIRSSRTPEELWAAQFGNDPLWGGG